MDEGIEGVETTPPIGAATAKVEDDDDDEEEEEAVLVEDVGCSTWTSTLPDLRSLCTSPCA